MGGGTNVGFVQRHRPAAGAELSREKSMNKYLLNNPNLFIQQQLFFEHQLDPPPTV